MSKGSQARNYDCEYIEAYIDEMEAVVSTGDGDSEALDNPPVTVTNADRVLVGKGLSIGGAMLEARLGIDGVFTTDWMEEGTEKLAPLAAKYGLSDNLMPEWLRVIYNQWQLELEATLFIGATVWNIREALMKKQELAAATVGGNKDET